ncbi:hypothetical protein BGZ46_007274 [Entomortierella lignicola]|nr:hypothetical protein BGZ46_007274 [Entomortierella lignicola]
MVQEKRSKARALKPKSTVVGGSSSIASSSSAALARPSTLDGKDSDMATQPMSQITSYLEHLKDQVPAHRQEIDKMIPPDAVNMMYPFLCGRFRPIINVIEGTKRMYNVIQMPGHQDEATWMKASADGQAILENSQLTEEE